jgi:hypothetical protein
MGFARLFIWSARELAPLLGYNKWQNFGVAIRRAMTACEQVGQVVADQFTGVSKLIDAGKGAKRPVQDYLLSRFACYLIAQNGDPRKPEIAAAQAYFAISTRQHELAQLLEEQEERLKLRERVSEDNKALASAAYASGVLSQNFGTFQNAGYKGLYGDWMWETSRYERISHSVKTCLTAWGGQSWRQMTSALHRRRNGYAKRERSENPPRGLSIMRWGRRSARP